MFCLGLVLNPSTSKVDTLYHQFISFRLPLFLCGDIALPQLTFNFLSALLNLRTQICSFFCLLLFCLRYFLSTYSTQPGLKLTVQLRTTSIWNSLDLASQNLSLQSCITVPIHIKIHLFLSVVSRSKIIKLHKSKK